MWNQADDVFDKRSLKKNTKLFKDKELYSSQEMSNLQ